MKKIRIMIADDSQMFRDLLIDGLNRSSHGKIELVGVAENGKVLLDLVSANAPDIVLLDLNMPVKNGIETLNVLSKNFPDVKPIILSDHCTDFYIACVILEGASAFIRKGSPFTEVLNAIEYVYENGVYLNEVISNEIIHLYRTEKKLAYIIENEKYSHKELQVLREVCKNLQVKEISSLLGISTSTVKYHKTQLFRKTQSEATIGLVLFAIRQGIYNPEDYKQKKKG